MEKYCKKCKNIHCIYWAESVDGGSNSGISVTVSYVAN